MGGGRTLWEPWYIIKPDGKMECKLCSTAISYRKDRLLWHLGWRRDENISGVRRCTKASAAVKALFHNCGGNVPPTLEVENDREMEDTSPAANPVHGPRGDRNMEASVSASVGGGGNTTVTGSHVRSSEPLESNVTPIRTMRQVSLPEGMNTSNKQLLDKKWANFFYEANIPFNVAKHPAFVDAVEATSKSKVVYKPPPYNAIRTKLMKAAKDEVATMVNEKTKGSIHKYGVTICSDGWDNVTNRPLINVMLACTSGEVFLGSVDTTGERKDANYVANCMINYIEAVGAENVVQVCTDNAANMIAAGELLVRRFPHVYFQGCAAHALDLLLEDWGKERWVKNMMKRARAIVSFIRTHHMPLAIFRRHSPNLILKNPAETRFATTFLMVDRLVKVRQAVEQTVVDPDWNDYVDRLTKPATRTKANTARRYVRSDGFWGTCVNFVHMVEPVLVALREFDGKHPCMGKAWLVMKNVEKHVFSLRDPPFSLNEELAESAEDQFQSRWHMLRTDLHYAGALLNPYLLDEVTLIDDREATEAVVRVLRKLTTNDVAFASALSEYQSFRDHRGIFAGLPVAAALNLEPHEWWDLLGAGAHTLAPIAKRILAQVCSASSCERNWSMYSFVHNKVRNRLTSERAEELVYIYTNARTLRDRGGANSAAWYANNMLSEDSMTEESDGLDRGSIFSDSDNYDSDDDDDAPFGGNPGRGPRRPVIDPAVFDFNDVDNNYGDDDGDNGGGPELANPMDNGENEDVPAVPPVPENNNDTIVVEEPAIMASLEEQQDGQGEEANEVVGTQESSPNSPHREGNSGDRQEMAPVQLQAAFRRLRRPPSDSVDVLTPSTQDSSVPSSSAMPPTRPREIGPSIGARLTGLGPTLNMTLRTREIRPIERSGPQRTNPHKRPREQLPRLSHNDRATPTTRTTRRNKRLRQSTQPFAGEVNLGGPNTDGVLDASGRRPLKTLSSLEPRIGNRRRNSPAGSSSTRSDDNETTDDTAGNSGEVPGDSDFVVNRPGPPPSPDNDRADPGAPNAGTSVRVTRNAVH
jgi:hypothetical protein